MRVSLVVFILKFNLKVRTFYHSLFPHHFTLKYLDKNFKVYFTGSIGSISRQ